MAKTAILIDGGYYRSRGRYNGLVDTTSAEISAEYLMQYCQMHLQDEADIDKRQLYRIFYYDCPPAEGLVWHPFKMENVDLTKTPTYTWTQAFYDELKKRRKVALRMGELSGSMAYQLKATRQTDIFSGSATLADIKEHDFVLSLQQKGVDMKIGLDIASLAYKHQVDQIILIAGDSDFIPAVKLARREGIDVILDTLGGHVKEKLAENTDGLRSHYRDFAKPSVHTK